jgi:hypothetical protein
VYRPLMSHKPNQLRIWAPIDRYDRAEIAKFCYFLKRAKGNNRAVQIDRTRTGLIFIVPRAHFSRVIEALALEFGECQVIADYSSKRLCDDRCAEATGEDCECICGGTAHGEGLNPTKQIGTLQIQVDRSQVEYIVTRVDVLSNCELPQV